MKQLRHQEFRIRSLIRGIWIYSGLFVFIAIVSALAQNSSVKVRLYSLHSEHRLTVTARTGEVRWRTCPQCEPKSGAVLAVEATDQGFRIDGGEPHKDIFIEGDYRIEPESGFKLSLNFPIEIRADRNSLKVFLDLPLEDYVTAALAGESGNFQQKESLKAMAVAVRTYAAHFRGRHSSEGFDFCDNTHCQALNFKAISPQVRAAVEATRGEMLWFTGSPAATYYHQNCGGSLAAAKEAWADQHAPYLKQQPDPYCVRGTPLHWKTQLSRQQLETALRNQGIAVPPGWGTLEVVSRSSSGRVLKLAFVEKSADVSNRSDPPYLISASALRFAIGRTLGWNQVRSDLYRIEASGDSIVFIGRGSGHGVGLCQAGAEQMAKEGKSYHEILAFYYPGTSLGSSATGILWQRRESELFEMLSPQPDKDAEVLRAAEAILPEMESELGWKLDFKPQLKIYPTLDAYRDSTGQPGWIAAFTRQHTIRLQPLAVLQNKGVLESTLRHELTHLLIEARAHVGTPLWFREGLVLFFADMNHNFEPIQMTGAQIERALAHPENRQFLEKAYAAARTKVAGMIQQNGKAMVLRWLGEGLP